MTIHLGGAVPTATMTSKGQITVPVAVRDDLGLNPGVRVRFVKLPTGGYELRPANLPNSALKGLFGAWEGPALTIDEMNADIADAAAQANQ